MTYLGKGGRIPYLCKEDIAKESENLLEECWDGSFPVDVEAICDDLNIGIMPTAGLSKNVGVDAFISTDFKTIYVDSVEYDKASYRYRFSIAHELGHFVLHKKYCSSSASDFNEWLKILHSVKNNYAEFQANYFAGSLLVPENELVKFLNDEFDGSFARNYWHAGSAELGEILARVRRHFCVSDIVIARRMRDAFPGVEEEANVFKK